MRLKPEKVELLAKKVMQSLQKHQRVTFVGSPDSVEGVVRRIILNDLRQEDALEKEAEEILKQHRLAIDRQNMSYNTLLTRTKQQLARKKKIVL